jgi:transcriptional regulator with XRE-family HTH domain
MVGHTRWTGRDARLLRVALRLSQRAFAARLGLGERTVVKWEQGGQRTTPRLESQAILDTALAQAGDDAQARFRQLVDQAVSRGAPSFNTGAAVPVLNDDEQRHMVAALTDARRYLDDTVVEYFGRQLDACEVNDGNGGSSSALPAVLGVLGAIESRASAVRPQVRRALLSLGARGAEFAGWLYRDINDLRRAARWYGRATEWAQEAGDTPMQGYVLLRKSQMAYDERDALRVFTLAEAASQGPWLLAPHVQAEALQQEARGLAMLGERIETVQRKLDHAAQLLANASDDTPDDVESTLMLREASCYIEAGKPRLAAEMYAQVLAGGHLSSRDRGYFLARSTSALALAGEPDEAAAAGLRAAHAASAVASQRTKRELGRAMVTLEPWRHRPGPQSLRDALTSLFR